MIRTTTDQDGRCTITCMVAKRGTELEAALLELLRTGEAVPVKVAWTDDAGKPAPIEGDYLVVAAQVGVDAEGQPCTLFELREVKAPVSVRLVRAGGVH